MREQPAGRGSGSGSLRQEPERPRLTAASSGGRGGTAPGPAPGAGSDPGLLLAPAADAGRGHRPRAPAPAGRSLPPSRARPSAGTAAPQPRSALPRRAQNPAWSSGAARAEGSPSAASVASGGGVGSAESAPPWGQERVVASHRRVQLPKVTAGSELRPLQPSPHGAPAPSPAGRVLSLHLPSASLK